MKLVTVPAVTQVGHGLTFSLAFEIIFLFMGGAKKKKKKENKGKWEGRGRENDKSDDLKVMEVGTESKGPMD